ncbi:hypothetical protein BVX98_03460 [bacterium F11]|nr:hypothetical protein BVX98_03460 [bacterium F11]
MKYMERGGFQNQPLMKLTLGFMLLFLLGLWISNFLLYFSKMGLTPESVTSYYLGSEAQFSAPRTYQSMLEVTHMHLPVMAIVILMLTHLIIFAPFKNPTKVLIIATSFLSAFLGEAAGWLTRFVNPSFSYLKIGCFFLFQVMLILLIFSLGRFLFGSHTKKRPLRPASRH